MKDTVEIRKISDTHFELTRTIVDKMDRLTLENQLQQLEQTEEQLIDQLAAVREKQKNIKKALKLKEDNSAVTGEGKVVNLKKEG